MNRRLLVFLVLLSTETAFTQNPERIKIDGVIFSETNDIEAVTVFNTSSNQGTITNQSGEFGLEVALNDIIEISALQFKPATITIDEAVFTSRQLKIQLYEQVNQLDAVTLSTGLSGNLATDIANVKEVKRIVIDMGDLSAAYEYNDDRASDAKVAMHELKKITNKGELYNGINFASLLGIEKIWFKWKGKQNIVDDQPKRITDFYSKAYISEICNIPADKIDAFIVFINDKVIQPELFYPENELKLLDYVLKQSKLFLNESLAKE